MTKTSADVSRLQVKEVDMRTNRFLGLRVGTVVWRGLLISCCTTIAAPDSAHVLRTGGSGWERGSTNKSRREELNPTQNSPRCRGPTGQGSAHPGYFRLSSHVCHTTSRPNRPTQHSARRQNARQQFRRVALSSHRCRPSLLSRRAIHEAFRLRCLDGCNSRLSVRLVFLGYVNSCTVG